MRSLASALVLLVPMLASCTSVDAYRAESDEPYVGGVLGQSDPGCDAGTGCSFLRRGFRPGTELLMTYDESAPGGIVGTLDTRMADGTAELCEPTFVGATLHVVEPLEHDTLSQLTFPGDGRLKTFVYAIDAPTGPLADRDGLAFVSLMRGGEIEVRILAGSGRLDCAPSDCAAYTAGACDYFGVFHMKRRPVTP